MGKPVISATPQPLLDYVSIPTSQRGRPCKRCKWLLADKSYDAEALHRYCDRYRMPPVIPLRSMKRIPKPGLPRLFDRPKYRQRSIIERKFVWLEENRRIATRFDKLAKSSAAMVSLACSLRGLRQLFSYRAKSASILIVGQAWRDGERAILALGLASWWLDVGC